MDDITEKKTIDQTNIEKKETVFSTIEQKKGIIYISWINWAAILISSLMMFLSGWLIKEQHRQGTTISWLFVFVWFVYLLSFLSSIFTISSINLIMEAYQQEKTVDPADSENKNAVFLTLKKKRGRIDNWVLINFIDDAANCLIVCSVATWVKETAEKNQPLTESFMSKLIFFVGFISFLLFFVRSFTFIYLINPILEAYNEQEKKEKEEKV